MPYGSTVLLYCGQSDHTTPSGNWSHDSVPLGVNSRVYTITNATFDDDGEYQCIGNGSGVFSSPLKVDVYGERCYMYIMSVISNVQLQYNLMLTFMTYVKIVCFNTPDCLLKHHDLCINTEVFQKQFCYTKIT